MNRHMVDFFNSLAATFEQYYNEVEEQVDSGELSKVEAARRLHWYCTTTAPRLLTQYADLIFNDRG